ncbi:MAG: hypothetical protein ABIM83_07370 [candidate division WOR-3 bacterium]
MRENLTGLGLKILRLIFSQVEITEDEKVKTALISNSNGFYSIKIGKKFKERYLKKKDDLYFVLLHEYLHALLSQFYVGKYYIEKEKNGKIFMNFIFDSIVNYFIAKKLFLKEPEFLKKFYKNLPFSIRVFLNPYKVIKDGKIINNLNFFLKKKKVFKYRQVAYYIKNFLYKENEDIHNFINFIKKYLKNFENLYKIRFIDEIKKIESKIPDFLKDYLRKSHKGGKNEEEKFEKVKIIDGKNIKNETIHIFKEAIKEAITKDDKFYLVYEMNKSRSVIPFPSRRETLFICRGIYPFFFSRILIQRVPFYKRPKIYIDVSGSTKEYWSFVYEICYFLKDVILEPIYIFSNKVYEITLRDLKEGKIKTTYGTDFDSIAKHAIQNDFKKILVITDGYANISKINRDKIVEKGIEVYIIILRKRQKFKIIRNSFINIAKKVWEVEL